jgi:hypothetical protein
MHKKHIVSANIMGLYFLFDLQNLNKSQRKIIPIALTPASVIEPIFAAKNIKIVYIYGWFNFFLYKIVNINKSKIPIPYSLATIG